MLAFCLVKSLEHIDHTFLDCRNILCTVFELSWRKLDTYFIKCCCQCCNTIYNRQFQFRKLLDCVLMLICTNLLSINKRNILFYLSVIISTIMKDYFGNYEKLTSSLKWSFLFSKLLYMLLKKMQKT